MHTCEAFISLVAGYENLQYSQYLLKCV